MSDILTRNQVIEAYRLCFDREPESEAVIASYLAQNWTLWQLLKILMDSPEGQRCQVERASQLFLDQPVPSIDTEATPEILAELVATTESAWSAFGATDPFWSVVTNDRYRITALDEAAREEFYASGAMELELFTAACRRNGIVINQDVTLLELGCGVGRIAEHLARLFHRYIGVDISASHLDIAGQRLSSQGITNALLLTLKHFLELQLPCDVLYSLLTLQHSPPPVMVMVLRACLSRLRPGGYAFFQLPCHLYDYEFQIPAHLSEQRDSAMEMHALPQAFVFRVLAEHDLVPLEVLPYPRIGPIGFSFAFLAAKRHRSL